MPTEKINIAIVGATGAVGRMLLSILDERKFPYKNIYLLASARSAGKKITQAGTDYIVQDVTQFDFSQVDIALFSAGASVSETFAPVAAQAGCIVIDNTSYFRYDDDIPLIIPEVNPEALAEYKKRRIIANPNCSTMQMLVALNPIYKAVGIERINVCTYQAVSGSGQSAINELTEQSQQYLQGEPLSASVYDKEIAFNVLPFIDTLQDNGYTKEEMKMVWETKKIFNDSGITVNPTAVRVPVYYGHAEAVHIETCDSISAAEAKSLLENAPGVRLCADSADYPTPRLDAAGNDTVFVGRVRADISHPRGLNLWVVADNLRKGAALNAVQIAELLYHTGEVAH